MTYSLFCNNNHHFVCILLLCSNLINYTSLQTTNGDCKDGTCDSKDKTSVAEKEQYEKAKYTGIFYSKLLIYIPTTFLVRTEKYSLKQYNKDRAREGDISPKLQCNVFHNGPLFSIDVYIDNFLC